MRIILCLYYLYYIVITNQQLLSSVVLACLFNFRRHLIGAIISQHMYNN